MNRKENKMSEEEKKDDQVLAKMEIIFYKDGNGRASGPLANKALCKAMLAMAAQIVDEWKPQIVGIKGSPFDPTTGLPRHEDGYIPKLS
jgi:hypothetical protein